MKTLRFLLVLLSLPFLFACADLSTKATAPAATDDCGPKPAHPGQIVATWANDHYRFLPPAPFTPEEFTISEPVRISLQMPIWFPVGRKVGWQIIVGPENRRLAQSIEEPYTRLIIFRDQVIFVESRNYPF